MNCRAKEKQPGMAYHRKLQSSHHLPEGFIPKKTDAATEIAGKTLASKQGSSSWQLQHEMKQSLLSYGYGNST
jgi:hypothetical protein